MHQDMTNRGHKASSHLICTQATFIMISSAVSVMSLFRLTRKVNGHTIGEILYYTNSVNSTAVKHVADNVLSCSRTAHWHIMHATQSTCRGANSQLHFL